MTWSEEERRALSALLDEIIPPSADGRMPGAGDVVTERLAGEIAARPDLLTSVRSGLGTLDRVARGEVGESFAGLSREDRRRLFEQVVEAEPDLVPSLVFSTYVAYYEHPRVLVALGREPRPPHPGGYEIEPFDPSLLENVRRRARLYREC